MPKTVLSKDEIDNKIEELQEALLQYPDDEEYMETRNTTDALIQELEKTKLKILELEERTLKALELEEKLRRLRAERRRVDGNSRKYVEEVETSDVRRKLGDGRSFESLYRPSCSNRTEQQDAEIIFFGNRRMLTKEELDFEKGLMKEITGTNLNKETFSEEETYHVEEQYGYWDTPLMIDGELVHVGEYQEIQTEADSTWNEEEMAKLTITTPEVETAKNSKSIENIHTSFQRKREYKKTKV